LPAKQALHQKRQPVSLTLVPAVFDADVLVLDKACFLQALAERSHAVLQHLSERFTAEKPHHRHCRLLRARRDWPRRRAAEKGDELAPSHVGHGLPLRRPSAAPSAYHRLAGWSLGQA
jgi:hypothetical protein